MQSHQSKVRKHKLKTLLVCPDRLFIVIPGERMDQIITEKFTQILVKSPVSHSENDKQLDPPPRTPDTPLCLMLNVKTSLYMCKCSFLLL